MEALGKLVRVLDLDEQGYEACIELAEKLLQTPEFQRLMNLITSGLAVAPVMDAESVEILRRAAGFPDPQPVGKEA
jgi:hypothetical protein